MAGPQRDASVSIAKRAVPRSPFMVEGRLWAKPGTPAPGIPLWEYP